MRRGYSLIEMVAVMTVGSLIFGVSVAALLMLLGTEHTGRQQMQQRASLARLAKQFREDVHAAVREMPRPEAGAACWSFEMPGGKAVEYNYGAGGIERIETSGEKVERRETYTLPAGAMVNIARAKEASPATVTLVVRQAEGDRELCISAVLGKDHRFAAPPKEGMKHE